jgi:excisionase family DNA binding protein
VTLTSAEAAEVLGITPSGLRTLVQRGRLTPVNPGAHLKIGRPQQEFLAKDVYDLQVARRTKAEIAWQQALWAEVDRLCAAV